jgi:hypothetical protein
MKNEGMNNLYETPEFRQIPDYCPLRHRNSIIRLLILLEGRDVALDSAARVWTMVAVAKILDCTSVVRDKVAQWLLHARNARFIEVLPEEALKIGNDLQLQQITQTAFRILVNELALEEADTNRTSLQKRARTTVFGRRTGECSDELNNLIQHAARALVERVTRVHLELQSPHLFDHWAIEEWGKLKELEELLTKTWPFQMPNDRVFGLALGRVKLLMHQLRGAISNKYYLSEESSGKGFVFLNNMDIDRATYVQPMDFEELEHILVRLNPIQKLLCPFIYSELSEQLADNLFTNPLSTTGNAIRGPSMASFVDNVQSGLEVLVSQYPRLVDEPAWQCIVDQTVFKNTSPILRMKRPVINLLEMESQVLEAVQPLTSSWVRHGIEPPANITRHLLLTLDREEMKFLPLWAGGLNDGTGGVFESHIPWTDMGPNGPGPAYHTGQTIPSAPSSTTGSLMQEISAMALVGSATRASVDVQDSISTVHGRDDVIADDVSIQTESFETARSDYDGAMFAVLADGQYMGDIVDSLVESYDDFEVDMEQTPDASDFGSDSDDSVVLVKKVDEK